MLKLITKKTSYWLVLILFYITSGIAQATQKIHPPYPDVWGYDMSEFPAVKWGLADVIPYAMDDGDIWFVVDYSYKKTNPMDFFSPTTDDQYVLIKFFKGEQTILNAQERKKLFKITEGKKISTGYSQPAQMTFSDGSKIKVHTYAPAKRRCYVPDYAVNYFSRVNAQGKEKKYSILAASSQVSIWESDVDCMAEGTSPFLYQKLCTLTDLIPLKDDTFIVISSESNLILRFDKDFKTKFKPVTPVTIHGSKIMRNFFVIDYALIEKFEAQSLNQAGSLYQNIHDALLTHFQEQYPHK
jgi:hypothetical protein